MDRNRSAAASGSQVLAQTSADATNQRFPLALWRHLVARDARVSIRFRAVAGKIDQAAGIVLRLKDKDNYYLARANALENNVRIYKVEGGQRSPHITSVDLPVRAGAWHTLAFETRGAHLKALLDGQAAGEVDDRTFADAGQVGLWTKADSVTLFDDVTIEIADIPQGGPSPAHIEDLTTRIGLLEDRVNAQAQDLARAKAQPTPAPKLSPSPSPTATATPSVSIKDGLFVKSADGTSSVRLTGVVQIDHRALSGAVDKSSTFSIRRVNMGVVGSWNKLTDYCFEMEMSALDPTATFSPRRLAIHNAYVGLTLATGLKLRAGQFKVPFETETTNFSDRYIDFSERSWIQRLVPGRDTGVMLHGELFKGRVDYAAGVFNGSTNESGGKNAIDTNRGKDLVAQARYRPLAASRQKWLKNLQLGGGYTTGDSTGDGLSSIASNDSGLRVLTIESGVTGDERRARLAGEIYWMGGPFSVKGEVAELKADLARASQVRTIEMQAYFVSASWLLTGEEKVAGRVTPKKDFSLKDKTWGSWEIAARLSGFSNRHAFDGLATQRLADPALSTNSLRSLSFALNWRLNALSRMVFCYTRESYNTLIAKSATSASGKNSTTLLTRFMVEF
ncbi:MAG: OprO/OprP family phosphate-selective porin [Vicinamibacteria bacterium]|nr:OprO/OprP family phosphate-selective porin [Vicinamibacteria bacterium]